MSFAVEAQVAGSWQNMAETVGAELAFDTQEEATGYGAFLRSRISKLVEDTRPVISDLPVNVAFGPEPFKLRWRAAP